MDERDLQLLVQVRRMAASGEARQLREAADLSRADVGGTVGVDQSTIWKWETGERRPRGPAALRYARVLQMLGRDTPTPAGPV